METINTELLIMGDFNGRVGTCDEKRNNNGQRVIDFCVDNNLVASNTFFKNKDIHKFTRIMDREERSIIDLVLVGREYCKLIKDVRVKRGFEIGSDYHLVYIKLKRKK